ncbi:hypothetical protein [Chondromyces crocatus]|uniref:Uncharacterized protein n=1 Tax=Chondromyces crocatus TaxID=52 RepID=A0A0K1EP49_CHOCO|nr:hypothetical protein [Chondromyces crocatus]AKT42690.1 uncharacterized protein CMC5_069170 [Chondromyces crocatus]
MSTPASRLRRSLRSLALVTQAALFLSLPACVETSSSGSPDPTEPETPETPDPEIPDPTDPETPEVPYVLAISGEVALSAPTLGPAAQHQDHPAIAWNGDHYLLVWEDNRRSVEGGVSHAPDLWAARVSADGTFLDPTGKLLIEGAWAPTITSDGTDFRVGFIRYIPQDFSGRIELAHVSAAGELLSETPIPCNLNRSADALKVAFDGTNYVVVWANGDAYHARVSPQGVVLGGECALLAPAYQVDVAFDGTNSQIVLTDLTGVKGYRLDPQGNLVDSAPLVITPPGVPEGRYYNVGVACTGGVCTVAWGEGEYELWGDPTSGEPTLIQAARVTSGGVLLDAQPITLVSDDPYNEPFHLDVAIDGQDAVVVAGLWTTMMYEGRPRGTVMAARLTAQGLPVGSPHVLASAWSTPGVFGAITTGGPRPLVVWSDQADSYGPGYDNDIKGVFVDATGPVGAPILLEGAPDQRQPSVAFDGENFVVAWSDGRNGHQGHSKDIYVTRVSPGAQVLDPQGVRLSATTPLYGFAALDHRPRVVFDGEKAVVSYLNCEVAPLVYTCVTALSRISTAGAVLDAASLNPLMLHLQLSHGQGYAPPVLSGDGGILVVEPRELATAHIDQSGQITRDYDLDEETYYFRADNRRTASASSGSEHLYLYATTNGQIQGVRLALDGTPLDGGARFAVVPSGSQVTSFSAAFDGQHYIAVWVDEAGPAPRILASRITTTGTVVDTTPVLIAEHPGCDTVALDTQGAVRGTHRTIVAWKACGPNSTDLFGALLDGDLTAEHFTLTSDAFTDEAPALSSSGSHILATYSSTRLSAPLGAERVYARLLTEAPPSP